MAFNQSGGITPPTTGRVYRLVTPRSSTAARLKAGPTRHKPPILPPPLYVPPYGPPHPYVPPPYQGPPPGPQFPAPTPNPPSGPPKPRPQTTPNSRKRSYRYRVYRRRRKVY